MNLNFSTHYIRAVKRYGIVLFLIAIAAKSFAQTFSPQVYSAQGGTFTGSNVRMQYTIGEPLTPTFTAGGYRFSLGFEQPMLNIAIGSISAGPFCAGSTITVPFTAQNILDSTNVFSVQLSDSAGNFFYPITIGTDTSRASGTITATIPFNVTGGTHYQVMIFASSNPNQSAISAYFTINSIGAPNNIGSYSMCSDSAYTFTFDSITAGSGGNEVEWSADSSFGSVSYIAAGANVSMTVAAGSDSVIWVRSVDSTSGCYSQPEKVMVQVNRNPVDTAANTGPYCYEGTITLNATPANLAGYVWSGPDSTFDPITASTTLVAAGNGGTYTVTVTDFNGCTASATTTVSVNAPMAQPTTPVSQSTCSDTALTFTFIDTIASSGNRLEWATNSMFLNSQFAASPDTLSFTVGAGGNITVYIRSSDSTSGCTSVPVTATATVFALPFPLTPTVSRDTICPTSSTTIQIPNSENGKNYLLQVGGSTVAIGGGNGFTLSLSTGSVDSTTTFTVLAIDTLSGCYRQLQPAITVYVDSVIPAPGFIAGDTILYTDEIIQYLAANLSGSSISYFIDTGTAIIDRDSGWVFDVSSSFIVEAVTAAIPGCTVGTAYLPVTFSPTPQAPAIPASQTAWSDTAVTFVLPDIEPGRGGSKIEWSLDSTFGTYNIFDDSGSITQTVDTSSTDTIFIRSVYVPGTKGEGALKFIYSGAVKATLNVNRLPLGVTGLSDGIVDYVDLPSPDLSTTDVVGLTPTSNSATPTGSLSYTIPITCPTGTNGMVPHIALTYNSQGGNGIMGWGWGLSGLSTISRSGLDNFHDQKVSPITFSNTDPFNLDGARLTVLSGVNGADGAIYAKETDDFSAIESMGSYGGGPEWFKVITKDGITMEYGNTSDSRFTSSGGAVILQWKINKIYDADGNYILFTYDRSDGNPKITEIQYTGNATQGVAPYVAMFFSYGTRNDNNITYTAGIASLNQHLLSSIKMQVTDASTMFKEYDLNYSKDDLNSYLTSVTEVGSDGTSKLNPTKFSYGSTDNNYGCTAVSSSFDHNGTIASINPSTISGFASNGFNTSAATPTEISGDFNGDGYSDMMVLYQATSTAAKAAGEITPYNLAFTVNFMNPATGNFAFKREFDKTSGDEAFIPSTGSLAGTSGYTTDHENYDYFVGDFLGLGRDGILEIKKYISGGALTIAAIKYYTFDRGGACTITSFALPATTTIASNTGYISVGDFDGDGKTDYILYNNGTTTISFPAKNNFNETASIPQAGSYISTSGSLMNSFVIDFDGDSKSDILSVLPTSSQVYFFNGLSGGVYTFSPLPTALTYPTLNNDQELYFGDFNGDGKTDIVTREMTSTVSPPTIVSGHPYLNSTSYTSPLNNPVVFSAAYSTGTGGVSVDYKWYQGLSTGKTFIKSTTAFLENNFVASVCNEVVGGGCFVPDPTGEFGRKSIPFGKMTSSTGTTANYQTQDEYYDAINMPQELTLADFNGDGKTDVLYNGTYAGYGVPEGCATTMTMFYSNGSKLLPYAVRTKIGPLNYQYSVTGDFNGDGQSDISFYNVMQNTQCGAAGATSLDNSATDDYYQISFNPFSQERLMHVAINSLGQANDFSYKRLTDPSVHTIGNTNFIIPPTSMPAAYFNPDPVTSTQMPTYAVSTITGPDGIGGTHSTTYNYINALMHQGGRGFIGFASIKSSCDFLNTTTQVSSTFTYPYYTPTFVNQITSVNGAEMNSVFTYNMQKQLGTNHYTIQKIGEEDENELVGSTAITSYGYDNYGNMNLTSTSVNGILESTTTTSTFSQFGPCSYPSKLASITISKKRLSAPSYTSTITCGYDSKGHLTSKTPSQACGVSYVYQPDAFGNVYGQTSKVTIGGSHEPRSETVGYDTWGRFPAYSYNSLSEESLMQYDPNWGKPTSIVGVDNNTTSYTYDAFGRALTIVPPRGNPSTISMTYYWDINKDGSNSLYKITTTQSGKPTVVVWYDAMGREVERQTMGFAANWLTSHTTYTNLNKVAAVTKPCYSSELPSFNNYTYDYLNRPTNISDQFGNNTTIAYVCGSGKTQVTTTDAAGHVSVKTTDATGKITESADNAGGLSFAYDSYGNETSVTNSSNKILMQIFYDPCNHKKEVIDASSGTSYYTFDGYGQMAQNIDGNNSTYNMQYDALGRLTQQAGPEGTSSYSYNGGGVNNDPVNGANKVSSVTGFSGVVQNFGYDVYGDVTSVGEIINGTTYTTSHHYDAFGFEDYRLYPSGIKIDYTPDSYGYLTTITEDGGPTLYTANAVNSYSQATSYTLGNGITSTLSTHFGFPTNYATTSGTIQNLTLTYDYTSGDLTKRQDNLAAAGTTLIESFTYDASDRLTQSQVNSNAPMTYTFADNGNITSKTDAGNTFDYDPTKINAVVSVSNEPGNISNNEQNITYVGFNKAAEITENGFDLKYTYAADYSRKYSELDSPSGTIINTRIYSGSYEINDDQTGNPQQIHYIYGHNGLVAMIVKDNSGTHEYYTYTDQLGSILTVTDNNATIVAQQNFDAWGRNRNPNNWSYSEPPTNASFQSYNYRCPSGVPNWLYRGYTGHEMLPEFGLVNMNGRMYDPLLGRMLSPDNNVQDPTNTQSYNKYSYVTNNPLKYNDPTGWRKPSAKWLADHSAPVFNSINAQFLGGGGAPVYVPWDGSYYSDYNVTTGEQINEDGTITTTTTQTAVYHDGSGDISVIQNLLSGTEDPDAPGNVSTYTQLSQYNSNGSYAVLGIDATQVNQAQSDPSLGLTTTVQGSYFGVINDGMGQVLNVTGVITFGAATMAQMAGYGSSEMLDDINSYAAAGSVYVAGAAVVAAGGTAMADAAVIGAFAIAYVGAMAPVMLAALPAAAFLAGAGFAVYGIVSFKTWYNSGGQDTLEKFIFK